jgi:ectoine hydroxylase-related dioxygenase (phytanoyl-CoA dioxygenase family)
VANTEAAAVRNALIDGDGFVRLNGLIDPDQALRLRTTMIERLDTGTTIGEGVLRLGKLLDWGDEFLNLATHPRLLSIAHALLGDDATLGSFSGRVLMPGCEMGALHVDWPYWAMDAGMPVAPPLMVQVIWMMEPFGATNGGTLVAAGSQKWQQPLDLDRFGQHAIQVKGNAGDAIVSHGLLWHRTALNKATEPRVAVLINYTQLTVRPMVPLGEFTQEFRDRASPQLAALLGFDYQAATRRRQSKLR